jgi:inhibitor of growth protein 3
MLPLFWISFATMVSTYFACFLPDRKLTCCLVANLPAEIAHLLEEIQAKDQHIQDLRDVINTRDRSIQNFVRAQGGHVKNPKEDGLTKVIMANFDRIEILQAEKLGLSEKAMRLVSTHLHDYVCD